MKEAIQDIYGRMAAERFTFSQKEFSRHWLGMSESYWAYIRSSGSLPSAEVMITLYINLCNEHNSWELRLREAKSPAHKRLLIVKSAFYRNLADQLFVRIFDRDPTQLRKPFI